MLTIVKNVASIEDTSPHWHKYYTLYKTKIKLFSVKNFKKSSIGDTRPLELKYLTIPNTLN